MIEEIKIRIFWCLFYQNRLKIDRDMSKKLYNWHNVENTPIFNKKIRDFSGIYPLYSMMSVRTMSCCQMDPISAFFPSSMGKY